MRAQGLVVRDVIVLIDRDVGAARRLQQHGLHLLPILSLRTMLNYYMSEQLIREADLPPQPRLHRSASGGVASDAGKKPRSPDAPGAGRLAPRGDAGRRRNRRRGAAADLSRPAAAPTESAAGAPGAGHALPARRRAIARCVGGNRRRLAAHANLLVGGSAAAGYGPGGEPSRPRRAARAGQRANPRSRGQRRLHRRTRSSNRSKLRPSRRPRR